MENNIPVVGQTYYYFDDGKIKVSRRTSCTITELIPFDEIDSETLELWKEEVKDCYWLYANETDYFAKGVLKDSENENVIFVRTIDNYWFSLGFWGGRLDIDGSLNDWLNNMLNK
jgi:hypothetical protein